MLIPSLSAQVRVCSVSLCRFVELEFLGIRSSLALVRRQDLAGENVGVALSGLLRAARLDKPLDSGDCARRLGEGHGNVGIG